MNRQSLQNVLACALLLAATTAVAGTPAPTSAPVPAPAPALSFDCAVPVLPSQRAVGELTGQNNVAQVYATRTRLMAEVKRACQRSGTTRVVVMPPPPEMRGTRLAQQKPTR